MTLSEQVIRIMTGLKKHPTLMLEVKRQLNGVHVLTDWVEDGHQRWIRFEGQVGKAHVSRTQEGLWNGRAETTTVVGEFVTEAEAKRAVDTEMLRRGFFLADWEPQATVLEAWRKLDNLDVWDRQDRTGRIWGRIQRQEDGPEVTFHVEIIGKEEKLAYPSLQEAMEAADILLRRTRMVLER